jgi:hypothetical protein
MDEENREATNRPSSLEVAPLQIRPAGLDQYNSVLKRDVAANADSESLPTKPPHPQHPSSGLTQDNLVAYHDALVAAANAAAANGKFRRNNTPDEGDDDDDDNDDDDDEDGANLSDTSQPGLIADDGRPSEATSGYSAFSPLHLGFGSVPDNNYDDFDYDDLEDDPMIAAANAEALANDTDGFYGQEFGFYASTSGPEAGEYFSGGYFGQRDADGLLRSHSGRVALREPNLTPITELSEYSNRNSFISLARMSGVSGASFVADLTSTGAPGGTNGTMSSPGLAQLAGMMQGIGEDDVDVGVSMEALRKLRRGAWGGSNGSLRSSGASPGHASPGHSSPGWSSPLAGAHRKTGSVLSAPSSMADEEAASSPVSPTVALPQQAVIVPTVATPELGALSSPVSPVDGIPTRKIYKDRRDSWRSEKEKGHSRRGSAAESVSYVKIEDEADGEDGSARWMLERRRTAESGEMIMVGRELVTGGRI